MTKNALDRACEDGRRLEFRPGHCLSLARPLVMGVLNVTPDSFSDGGRFATTEQAVEHALRLEEDGADIIDIGGESTRPGAEPVDEDKEKERVLPVIRRLRDLSDIPISIDTYKSGVAEAALAAGADMVNDVSACSFDTHMFAVLAATGAPVVLMHMQGSPREMQVNPHYEDCVAEIKVYLQKRIERCLVMGIDRSKIIVDPGIGFGKRLEDNLQILRRFNEFLELRVPVMIAASRKSFIGKLHNPDSPPDERIGGSLAAAIAGANAGASIIRAHDVAQTVEAMHVTQAIMNSR
ncbi:MAG: dihydropteroate synthase [bacterium]